MCYILFCLYLPQKKKTVTSSHTVCIQSPLGSHLCDVFLPLFWSRVSFFSVDEKVNKGFFYGWKESMFSSFFSDWNYKLCSFSCSYIMPFTFLTIFCYKLFLEFLCYPSLVRRNEFLRLSWLFFVVNVVILKSRSDNYDIWIKCSS